MGQIINITNNSSGSDFSGLSCQFIGMGTPTVNHLGEPFECDEYHREADDKNNSLLLPSGLSNITPGVIVNSASLQLYQEERVGGDTFNMRNLLVSYTQPTATWNNRAIATPWDSAGAESDLDRDPAILGSMTNSGSNGYKTFDIPNAVNVIAGMINQEIPIYGFQFENIYTVNFRYCRYRSHLDSDGTRPILTLDIDLIPPQGGDEGLINRPMAEKPSVEITMLSKKIIGG